MPSTQPINFRGRFEYLQAATEHWPELLKSLRTIALRRFAACMRGRSNRDLQLACASYTRLWRDARNNAELKALCTDVRVWRSLHGIREDWMVDAALQTLAEWSRGSTELRWYYYPEELQTPRFTPTFGGMWLPQLTPWREFKRSTNEQYRQELNRYRTAVAQLWGADRKSLPQQAIWTVLWQRGKSLGEVRLWEKRRHRRNMSEPNIQRRVHQFATSIGLTLRQPKRGPRKKT